MTTAILAVTVVLLAISQIVTAITFMRRLSFLEDEKERTWTVIDTIIKGQEGQIKCNKEQVETNSSVMECIHSLAERHDDLTAVTARIGESAARSEAILDVALAEEKNAQP